jgi:transcriptional regulator with XRE-family HTH domain
VKSLLKTLGQRIRELRTEKSLSQEEFAEIAGLHRTYIGHVESGGKNLSFNNLVRIAKALDVTLSELLAGYEEKAGLDSIRQLEPKPGRMSLRSQQAATVMAELKAQRELLERTLQAVTGKSGKPVSGRSVKQPKKKTP